MSDAQEPIATADDPFAQFAADLQEAEGAGIADPNAMVLSTVDPTGQPSSRVVLLKGLDGRGFVFYTNLGSRKAGQLAANPRASLSFFWRELGKQITVLGTAEPVTEEEADLYFASRPRGSQIGAWASRQSRVLDDRSRLLAEVARFEDEFRGRSIPRPSHWSGFRIVPSSIEFWIAGDHRLHHRIRFDRTASGWRRQLLFP